MCKLKRGINIICEQKSGLYPLLILGEGWGGVNKILPLLILGEGWGGVKFIKKPIGFPIGFKYVRVRRFIITYAEKQSNGLSCKCEATSAFVSAIRSQRLLKLPNAANSCLFKGPKLPCHLANSGAAFI